MTTKLAWKNIWRNKIRTGVFLAAALFGFGVAIFAINLMKSISKQRTEDAINIQTAHLQVHRKGFRADREISAYIPEADQIAAQLMRMPAVGAHALRLSGNAVIASPENSVAGEIKGVKPEEEARISVLKDFLVEGRFLDNGSRNQILISRRTADKLKVGLKSKVVITLKDAKGDLSGAAFKVCGLFSTPSTPFDESTFLVGYSDLQELMQVDGAHEIAIRLKDLQMLASTENQLRESLGAGMEISNWKALLPELTAFDGFLNMVGMLFSLVLIIGLGFSLMNTMNMIVQERTREIGMLRAIGLSRSQVFSMLMKESAFLMLLGSAMGIALGVLMVMVASKTGITITSDGGALGIRSVVYPGLNPGLLAMIILLAGGLTAIISVFPALRALNIQARSALRD